jgi:2-keto-4-pentenoate hydratase/2-oxohepta-3-ene-1,7-dioic acid hydratase in catechol pathway
MTMGYRAPLTGAVLAAGLFATAASAQPATPFKLGAFETGGRAFVGMVVDGDTRVLDIGPANAAFQRRNPKAARIAAPADMKQLIARYGDGLGARLKAIAAAEKGAAAPYAYKLSALKILPPVRPAVILNAGANYSEHARGIVEQEARAAGSPPPSGPSAGPPGAGRPPASTSAPGLWTRPPGETRQDNPYLFLKSPTVVVGANDDVVIPRGRTQIDWECEFATVVGKPAKNVPVAQAADYIFGYTIEFDVSDRGGRGDRKMGGGPDWFIQKNHDTFGPIGPFIVPKEFLATPMNVRHFFTLNGEIKQDSNTGRMDYNIWEMLAYGSNVMTLSPGDIISHGSPAGTNIERENPRWMQPGDVGVCTVEGVGTQRHNIVAEK